MEKRFLILSEVISVGVLSGKFLNIDGVATEIEIITIGNILYK